MSQELIDLVIMSRAAPLGGSLLKRTFLLCFLIDKDLLSDFFLTLCFYKHKIWHIGTYSLSVASYQLKCFFFFFF